MREIDVVRDGRIVRVRDAGDPDGPVVLYFHGTPGSRLDVAFGDEIAAAHNVRLISFDRPGYGESTPAPFRLAEGAADALAIADDLGVPRFATLGLSGGGPFALATAAVGGDRITRVGVASGAGPFQQVPGALDGLDDDDRHAVSLLPADPAAAAAAFAVGFEPLVKLFRSGDMKAIVSAFDDVLAPRDRELLASHFGAFFAATMQEATRQGPEGGGWDNVAWIGPWNFDLNAVGCPVLLWYGTDDRMAPPVHGEWLQQNLPDARLILNEGEGHLGIYPHLAEMLTALTHPAPTP
jgi:pimeloyl-ACP methyl ester carboxylesterase